MRGRGVEQAAACRLTPTSMFAGTTTTYCEKVNIDGGETPRNDPIGFYHGTKVKVGKQEFVMCGPPVVFVAEPDRPELNRRPSPQLDLFA
jgi:hypothetical protein